ncbi:hypothetical protein ACE6H2_027270 [Prunus campanulata]
MVVEYYFLMLRGQRPKNELQLHLGQTLLRLYQLISHSCALSKRPGVFIYIYIYIYVHHSQLFQLMQLSNNMDSNITTELVASSSSPSTNSWKYDVFLCFRGADTRYSFTDHLHSSLLRRGINTFMDDDQLEKGQNISQIIFQAIEGSRISIIIFSENYASSTWCLEELAKIIEYKNSQDQIVIPVYHNVDPADVRNQRGWFGEAFARHEIRFKENLEMVERWRAALTQAADLAGMDFNNYGRESKFIHEIIEEISRQLNCAYLTYETNYPVEIDSRTQEINDLLGVGVADVRMVPAFWKM